MSAVSPLRILGVWGWVGVTDYDRLLLAADWRLDQLEAAIATTSAINRTHDLVAERNRLRRFARFCELAREFEDGGVSE